VWREEVMEVWAQEIERAGFRLLGWRNPPTDNASLGVSVIPTEPVHMQLFIAQGDYKLSGDEFERRLYILRKRSGSCTPP
jgi:glutamate synthase (NADPH/NADH) large chain